MAPRWLLAAILGADGSENLSAAGEIAAAFAKIPRYRAGRFQSE